MSLKLSYTLVAPFSDAFLTAATGAARKRSLKALAFGWFRLIRLEKPAP